MTFLKENMCMFSTESILSHILYRCKEHSIILSTQWANIQLYTSYNVKFDYIICLIRWTKYSPIISAKLVMLFLVSIHNLSFFSELKKACLFSLFPMWILMLLTTVAESHDDQQQPIKKAL